MAAQCVIQAKDQEGNILYLGYWGMWTETYANSCKFYSLSLANKALGKQPPKGYYSRVVLCEVLEKSDINKF